MLLSATPPPGPRPAQEVRLYEEAARHRGLTPPRTHPGQHHLAGPGRLQPGAGLPGRRRPGPSGGEPPLDRGRGAAAALGQGPYAGPRSGRRLAVAPSVARVPVDRRRSAGRGAGNAAVQAAAPGAADVRVRGGERGWLVVVVVLAEPQLDLLRGSGDGRLCAGQGGVDRACQGQPRHSPRSDARGRLARRRCRVLALRRALPRHPPGSPPGGGGRRLVGAGRFPLPHLPLPAAPDRPRLRVQCRPRRLPRPAQRAQRRSVLPSRCPVRHPGGTVDGRSRLG